MYNKIIDSINAILQKIVGINMDPFLPRYLEKIPLKIAPSNGRKTNNLSISSLHITSIIHGDGASGPKKYYQNR